MLFFLATWLPKKAETWTKLAEQKVESRNSIHKPGPSAPEWPKRFYGQAAVFG